MIQCNQAFSIPPWRRRISLSFQILGMALIIALITFLYLSTIHYMLARCLYNIKDLPFSIREMWWLHLFFYRLLLKQLVTMEVIQWTALWNSYKDEFENEKNMLGGSLGDKAAEDLKQRIIEHVRFFPTLGRVCCYLFCLHLNWFIIFFF